MAAPLLFNWAVSAAFGWGVYGLNLLRYWPVVARAPAYCGTIDLESLRGMDLLTLHALANGLVESDQRRLARVAQGATAPPFDGIVLHGLGNRFSGAAALAEAAFTGRITCGTIFFEQTDLPDARETAARYRLIIAGSSWCAQVLRACGVDNVATVIQGVDLSLFHPAPRAYLLEGRFAIFSGGKLEHRKGQDLVMLAFRAFAARHPEAVLVTAWHSPWEAVAVTLNANPGVAQVPFTAAGKVDTGAWAAANGLAPHQYIDLGMVPNFSMARMLREMDVAVFPNRCEGGTNLVAMECMACGVPTIVSANTGHLDLVKTGTVYPLNRQRPVASTSGGTDGWGESDVEEIVEALEGVWADRAEAARRGEAAATAVARWSWRNQIGVLHDTLAAVIA